MSETRKPSRWLGPVATAISGVCVVVSQAIQLRLGHEPRWLSWVLLVLGALVAVSVVLAVRVIRAERRGRGGGVR